MNAPSTQAEWQALFREIEDAYAALEPEYAYRRWLASMSHD